MFDNRSKFHMTNCTSVFVMQINFRTLKRDDYIFLLQATTDTKDSCTLGHTGTSAAAPLAAGIIALALHAK